MKKGKGGPPGPGKNDHPHSRDPDDKHKEERGKRTRGKFDRIGMIDKELDSAHDDSMEESLELEDQKERSDQIVNKETVPLAAFHPNMGIVEIGNSSAGNDNALVFKVSKDTLPVSLD